MGPVRKNNRKHLVSEINVTPLVDVMLVLLIIFMVTAPMMTQGLDVDLPETTAKSLRQNEHPQVITINKDGEITINESKIVIKNLFQHLDKFPEDIKKEAIYLKADKNVPYGIVVTAMADVKAAGFDKLGMITQPLDKQ